MALELKQQLKLSQQLVMTPQLKLSLKILQITRLELMDLVREELEENPVLEATQVNEDESQKAEEKDSSEDNGETNNSNDEEFDWQSYIEENDNYAPSSIDFSARDDDRGFNDISSASEGEDLNEYLLWQLQGQAGSNDDGNGRDLSFLNLCKFIIGNIDDRGFLSFLDDDLGVDGLSDKELEGKVLDGLVTVSKDSSESVTEAINLIQSFDPPGVGARSMSECLLIQARRLLVRDPLAEMIIRDYLHLLGAKNYKTIAKALGVALERIYEASTLITEELNPVPAKGFGSDSSSTVIPDAYVIKVGDDYIINANDDGMPKLKISRYYKELLKNGSNIGEAKSYIRERLNSALWMIKSIQQRQRTLYRVVESIVKFQRDFFDRGLKSLKPLVLRDVAEDIEVHESTVSRVTAGKYVHTPQGVFELKFFFTNALTNEAGDITTPKFIKGTMGKLLNAEDKKKPLSDQRIVELLKDQDIELARRTVAKYREELGFLSSSKRKEHF